MRYGSLVEGAGTRAVKNFLGAVTAETAGHKAGTVMVTQDPTQTDLHPLTPTLSLPRTPVLRASQP